MRQQGAQLRRGVLVLGVLLLMAFTLACGSSSDATAGEDDGGATAAATTAPTVAATTEPTSAATSDATAPPTAATTAPTTAAAGGGDDDQIAAGQVIFQTAGGVGCMFCHGKSGAGDGEAGNGAPNIQGASKAAIRDALEGGVPLMTFIKLSSSELDAVAAYVKYLGEQ